MDAVDTTMGYFTSEAALRVLVSTKEAGYKKMVQTQWNRTSSLAVAKVPGVK